MTSFNAFHPSHMALPRAIGPYAVIRTTQIVSSSLPYFVFGPHQFEQSSDAWSNVCCTAFSSVTAALNGTNNAVRFVFEQIAEGAWAACTAVPAAFSIQVMNPGAVQTTSGIIYQGRFRTMPNYIDKTELVGDAANDWLSYNAPRLTSAAKLAFRGTHVDAVPFNMSKLSDFNPFFTVPAGPHTLSSGAERPVGFAPIGVYNPNELQLQFLVCCEWRVRFDPSNPAQAAHRLHPPASDWTWGKALKMLENGAHGVKDIVETVSQFGSFGQQALRAARSMPMIMG